MFIQKNDAHHEAKRVMYRLAILTIVVASSIYNGAAEQACLLCTDCQPPIDACCTPIVIDISGGGFHLTSAQGGVMFDIAGTGKPQQIAWTASGAMNAFLVLDRNGNGLIDSGKEMFGNFTEQPPSPAPNGFIALAEFDKPQNGGNGDGVIDNTDLIFASLRLWVDKNHDGISQAEELFTLPSMGIRSLSLSYRESRRRDQYGTVFRYRARLNSQDPDDTKAGPLAYDVFFTVFTRSPRLASNVSDGTNNFCDLNVCVGCTSRIEDQA